MTAPVFEEVFVPGVPRLDRLAPPPAPGAGLWLQIERGDLPDALLAPGRQFCLPLHDARGFAVGGVVFTCHLLMANQAMFVATDLRLRGWNPDLSMLTVGTEIPPGGILFASRHRPGGAP